MTTQPSPQEVFDSAFSVLSGFPVENCVVFSQNETKLVTFVLSELKISLFLRLANRVYYAVNEHSPACSPVKFADKFQRNSYQ